MEGPAQHTKPTREEQKSNLLKDEEELLLRTELIDRDIAQVQVELNKIHAAHYAIPRAPFSPEKPKIAQDSIIMGAVRVRISEEENRDDQYHTSQTSQYKDIRDEILETTREIDRDIAAADKGKENVAATTPPTLEQPVTKGQLRTDEGIHAANILVTIKRDGLMRRKREFEDGLRLTRNKLKYLEENLESGSYGVRKFRETGLEEDTESRQS
ncbi:hypothetical protein FKW77_010821 [Venturia effusa]|uniref:Uncharacterized protein n=1 Tax=Venturia effusa TaxID=50376 RepID=A0A517KYK0_9PEZI|nr:hypothetical protein FKW77_010821 [Venturia effusa]